MKGSSIRKIIEQSFAGGYLLLGMILCISIVYLCYALEWRGPMRDLWEFIEIIEGQLNGDWSWQRLIEPYGGIHRLLIPKLVFYLDYRFFSGSNFFALGFTLCLHITSTAIVLHAVQKNSGLNQNEKKILWATTLFFFFSSTQIYNLIYTSDNQVVISHSLAIIAAWLFTRDRILIAHIVTCIASLSHSSSLMMLPAMSIILLLRGQNKKLLLAQITFSLAVLALYTSGHDPLDTHTTSIYQKLLSVLYASLTQAGSILKYIGLHLSSPTSREHPNTGIFLTYASLLYLGSWVFRLYKNPKTISPFSLFFITLAAYVFFIAMITAYGRQIFPNSAFTDRYQTLVMTYWIALLMLGQIDLRRQPRVLALTALPVLTFFLLAPHQFDSIQNMANLSRRVHIAHSAATVGITDMNLIGATLSHPLLMDNKNLVARQNDFLRKKRLGYFSEPEARFFLDPQQAITLDARLNEEALCSGTVTSITSIRPGQYRITGTSQSERRQNKNILLLNARYEVVGYGVHDPLHYALHRILPFPTQEIGLAAPRWVAHMATTTEPGLFIGVLQIDEGEYCVLFEAQTPDPSS